MKVVAKEIMGTLKIEIPLAQQALGSIIKRYDYHELGGAPLLGVDGICIICHGSSGERAIKNALAVAARYAAAGLNARIVEELEASPKGPGEDE